MLSVLSLLQEVEHKEGWNRLKGTPSNSEEMLEKYKIKTSQIFEELFSKSSQNAKSNKEKENAVYNMLLNNRNA